MAEPRWGRDRLTGRLVADGDDPVLSRDPADLVADGADSETVAALTQEAALRVLNEFVNRGPARRVWSLGSRRRFVHRVETFARLAHALTCNGWLDSGAAGSVPLGPVEQSLACLRIAREIGERMGPRPDAVVVEPRRGVLADDPRAQGLVDVMHDGDVLRVIKTAAGGEQIRFAQQGFDLDVSGFGERDGFVFFVLLVILGRKVRDDNVDFVIKFG